MIRLRIPRTRATAAAAASYAASFLLAGFWCATPLGLLVASVTGHWQHGDARLFEPGGKFLVEVVRLNEPALAVVARVSAIQFVLASLLLLVPLSAVTTALNFPAVNVRSLSRRVLANLPSFVLLGGVSLAVRALITTALILVGGGLLSALAPSIDEKPLDGLLALWLFLLALAHGIVGLCFDFARHAVVLGSLTAVRALSAALDGLLRRPLRHVGAYLAFVAVSWCGPIAVATATSRVPFEHSGDWPLVGIALLHQAGVLWLLVGRYSWLCYAAGAMRALPELVTPERRDDTAEQTAVPDAPSQGLGA